MVLLFGDGRSDFVRIAGGRLIQLRCRWHGRRVLGVQTQAHCRQQGRAEIKGWFEGR
jgi:hypothetical protein